MKVFEGYLKCVRGNVHTILMYCMIFFAISLTMSQFSGKGQAQGVYSKTRLTVAVVDEDNSMWSHALTEYIAQSHEIAEVSEDKKSLADALYYDWIQYIVYIPENFEDKCLKGQEKLEVMSRPGTTYEYYVNAMLDTFVNETKVFLAAGYLEDAAAKAVLETGKEEGEVYLSAPAGSQGTYNVFRFMPYLYLSILCFTMGTVHREYQQMDMKRRLSASCVSLKKQNFQMLLAFLAVGISIWILGSLMGILLCWQDFMGSGKEFYFLANGAAVMLASLAAAFFVGTAAKTSGAVNGMANIVSLGFCMLGGIFVPLEMLTGMVKRVGQFLPTYWYSKNTRILCYSSRLTDSLQKEIWQGFLIQILFAAACAAAAVALNRARQQEE